MTSALRLQKRALPEWAETPTAPCALARSNAAPAERSGDGDTLKFSSRLTGHMVSAPVEAERRPRSTDQQPDKPDWTNPLRGSHDFGRGSDFAG